MSHETLGCVPRWAQWSSFALSLVGLGISLYLTITHFDAAALVCPGKATIINCAQVTTSGESRLLGIPVAFLGLGQYVVMSVLNSPWGWARPERWVHRVRVGLAIVGMGFVLWLLGAELLIIDHICLWCSGVHLVTFALLVIILRVGVPLGGESGEEQA